MKEEGKVVEKDTAIRRLSYHWVIVGATLCVAAVAYAVHYSFGIFFNDLAAEFNWTRVMTSGAFSLYMISRGVFGILTWPWQMPLETAFRTATLPVIFRL